MSLLHYIGGGGGGGGNEWIPYHKTNKEASSCKSLRKR